jgi:Kef-type K+ transport system membrane component KefB
MRLVTIFSLLLIVGMVGAQFLPLLSDDVVAEVHHGIRLLTLVALAFIMIHVGYEFELDKTKLRQYGWDYLVAMTAATFPWIFVTLYFVLAMLPAEVWGAWETWKGALLIGRFAAPTSTGMLFAMLAAAGLSATWFFQKARILVIFDDLDTVLLMIPLKMLMVGFAWQPGIVVVPMGVLLWVAWRYLHRLRLPITWPWVLAYAVGITGTSELIYAASKYIDDSAPIHLEVLLPAFVLGCVLARPPGSNPHIDDAYEGHQEGPESANEQWVATLVSMVFMVLVGLSLPPLFTGSAAAEMMAVAHSAAQSLPSWSTIAWHVLCITGLAILGKMVPAVCYRREAHWKERLALAIAMWPRGEVSAGVLVLSLSYGFDGPWIPIIMVATLSLALNLLLTGMFILLVKRLVVGVAVPPNAGAGCEGLRQPLRLESF